MPRADGEPTPGSYRRGHLHALEDEAVHVLRELAAERERPVLLFSGGKDSIVLLRLAEKAFRPARFPFPLMHVDTGHNFPEVIEYRDRRVAELGERLVVASVQDSIDRGRVTEETGPRASRNRLQTTTLLDAIEAHRFDAAIGGIVTGVLGLLSTVALLLAMLLPGLGRARQAARQVQSSAQMQQIANLLLSDAEAPAADVSLESRYALTADMWISPSADGGTRSYLRIVPDPAFAAIGEPILAEDPDMVDRRSLVV
ncbi:MAG: phosphoadenosine phosphosulfate reductase family protein, partial [Phycisphaerales bacterium]